jgi:rod shape-determining protein MreB
MIIDIGGGSTECAVISLGGVVIHKSARVAGNKLDESIAQFIKKRYNLIIGERTAEIIKMTVGDALGEQIAPHDTRFKPDPTEERIEKKGENKGKEGHKKEENTIEVLEVKGRDVVNGLPRMVEITPAEVTMAMQPVLKQMVSTVKAVLEETPPELAADIIDKGIVMAGGTSTLRNLDKLLTLETGVPCHVAEDALLCVVRGTGIAIENIELYKRSVNRK